MSAVLIATLGAEPQVVALATQILQQHDDPLAAVVVIHTDATRAPLVSALPALTHAFAHQPTWPPLYTQSIPIADVLTSAEFTRYRTGVDTRRTGNRRADRGRGNDR